MGLLLYTVFGTNIIVHDTKDREEGGEDEDRGLGDSVLLVATEVG